MVPVPFFPPGCPGGTPPVVVVTADSAILDRCGPWFNLAQETIRRHVPGARLVELGIGR